MSIEELSKYYKLKIEIDDLQNRIKEFGFGLSSFKFTDEVKGKGNGNSVQEKYMALNDRLIEKRISALEEFLKIENFIEQCEDAEIRTIMRKRFLDLKNWEQIGEEIHCDRTTAPKKLKRYLKEYRVSHNSH